MTTELLQELKDLDVAGKDIKTLYMEISALCMKHITPKKREGRRAYYLSIEYLMGRMFHNNLLELGVLEEAEKILSAKGVNVADFEEIEDAAATAVWDGLRLAFSIRRQVAHILSTAMGYAINTAYSSKSL